MNSNHLIQEEITQKIKTIFQKFYPEGRSDITLEEPLKTVFDSLTLMEIIFKIEDELDIELDDEVLPRLTSLKEILIEIEAYYDIEN